MAAHGDLSLDDLKFIRSQARATPIRSSDELNAQLGRTIHIKDETVQLSGSFKFRGALLGVRNSRQGVVAAGAGNFPIAVGWAAKTQAKSALLIMPRDVPLFKLEQAKRTGANIELVDRSELIERAETDARRLEWRNLHAFEDIEMIAGSYTLGSEIAAAIVESRSNSNAVVVACGGGGLAAGVTLALRSSPASAEIYVVEPETHQRYAHARARRAPITIDPTGNTSCDALRSRKIGARAFGVLEQSNVRVCAVDDELVGEATSLLRGVCGIRVEPSGAIALGAVLGGMVAKQQDRVWVIACGGNVGPE